MSALSFKSVQRLLFVATVFAAIGSPVALYAQASDYPTGRSG